MRFSNGFVARPYQIDFLREMGSGCRRAVLVWHRRAGKDLVVWNWTIYEAYRKKGIYFYFFPTYAQGKKILWDGMDNNGRTFLNYIPYLDQCKLNETEMQITLPNGSIIQIVGTDKLDNVVGTNPIGCVFSEYAIQNPQAWSLIRPILEANKGWAAFVYTPRGSNHAKDLWDIARDEANSRIWYAESRNILQTCDELGDPIISMDQIEQMRSEGEDEDLIQQEYFVSFTGAQQGSYYSTLMRKVHEEGRVRDVPFEPSLLVDTIWDIGHGDATVIGFRQLYDGMVRWINCICEKNQGLPYFASEVQRLGRENGYRYRMHLFPHDMKVTDYGIQQTRILQASNLGLTPNDVVAKLPLDEGIDAVRRRFHRYVFDRTKCAELVKALTEYKRKFNKQTNLWQAEHEKTWARDYADMVRYEAVYGDIEEDAFDGKKSFSYFDPLATQIEPSENYDPFSDRDGGNACY